MKKLISYMDGLETVEMPYFDKDLISEVSARIEKIHANEIKLSFCQTSDDYGTVFVSICNMKLHDGYMKPVASEVLCLHEIHLTEESFKDYLPEFQREKNVLKRAFPNMKVSSSFR